MAIEIEKKYRVNADQFVHLAGELAASGAEYVSEDFEVNTIFASEALIESAAVIRIRTTADRAILTFKKRLEDLSDAKHQLEIESEISDAQAVAEILGELGVKPRLVYEKRRRTYTLRSAEVVLDELPFGLFVEIEGTVLGIKEAEMILGMEDFEVETETYPRLTARLGVEHAGMIEARFKK